MARKNPRRNIARINMTGVTGTNYGGWEVRFSRKGNKVAKFFSDTKYGGKRAALAAAKECRDELELEHKKYTVEELAKRPSKRNTSGTVGVRLINRIETHGGYEYPLLVLGLLSGQTVVASGARKRSASTSMVTPKLIDLPAKPELMESAPANR